MSSRQESAYQEETSKSGFKEEVGFTTVDADFGKPPDFGKKRHEHHHRKHNDPDKLNPN